jgi:flagellin-like protein
LPFGFRIIQNVDSRFIQVKYKRFFSIKTTGREEMSIKRVLSSKKAISPILATLLLIVIAVAAIVVTYAWITTYMGSATQQAGVLLYKENVRFDTAETVITVGNSGTEDTRVVRVYLGDSSGNMTDITSAYTDVGSGMFLNAGETATITIDWPNDVDAIWGAGETYYFRIVPSPGQFLEFHEQAPQ